MMITIKINSCRCTIEIDYFRIILKSTIQFLQLECTKYLKKVENIFLLNSLSVNRNELLKKIFPVFCLF